MVSRFFQVHNETYKTSGTAADLRRGGAMCGSAVPSQNPLPVQVGPGHCLPGLRYDPGLAAALAAGLCRCLFPAPAVLGRPHFVSSLCAGRHSPERQMAEQPAVRPALCRLSGGVDRPAGHRHQLTVK